MILYSAMSNDDVGMALYKNYILLLLLLKWRQPGQSAMQQRYTSCWKRLFFTRGKFLYPETKESGTKHFGAFYVSTKSESAVLEYTPINNCAT